MPDLLKDGYDVFSSVFEITATFDQDGPTEPVSASLEGATAVRRSAAKISGNKFSIATQFLALDHRGSIPGLGDVMLSLSPAAPPAAGRVTGGWDAKQNAPRWPAQSIFENVAVQLETSEGTLEFEPATASAEIHGLPPKGDSYGHPQQIKILKNKKQIGKAKVVHRVKNGEDRCPEVKHPCSPPCCSVEAHGHCTCFLVRKDGPFNEQLVFVASDPRLPESPVALDRVLVYKTITNNGPAAVTVFWDGPPPTYEDPNRRALLLPDNSISLAVSRAVKIVYSPKLGNRGDHARGHDVTSWCCPEWLAHPLRIKPPAKAKG